MTILWSVQPMDIVFANAYGPVPTYKEISVEGATMVVEPLGGGVARIERLISGNPQHYLRPEWQPGSHIRYP
jgi:hypothetical protein